MGFLPKGPIVVLQGGQKIIKQLLPQRKMEILELNSIQMHHMRRNTVSRSYDLPSAKPFQFINNKFSIFFVSVPLPITRILSHICPKPVSNIKTLFQHMRLFLPVVINCTSSVV
ncbi:hypothetical protein Peur_008521 [Populus x canadensis]